MKRLLFMIILIFSSVQLNAAAPTVLDGFREEFSKSFNNLSIRGTSIPTKQVDFWFDKISKLKFDENAGDKMAYLLVIQMFLDATNSNEIAEHIFNYVKKMNIFHRHG
jgi:hypothetical protein